MNRYEKPTASAKNDPMRDLRLLPFKIGTGPYFSRRNLPI